MGVDSVRPEPSSKRPSHLKLSLKKAFTKSSEVSRTEAPIERQKLAYMKSDPVPRVSTLEERQVKRVVSSGLAIAGKGTSTIFDEREQRSPYLSSPYISSHSTSDTNWSSSSETSILKIPNQLSGGELKLQKKVRSPSLPGSATLQPGPSPVQTENTVKSRKVSTSSSKSLITSSSGVTSKKALAQWYITKIMSNQLTYKQYKALWTMLHRGSYEFVKEFINANGNKALCLQLERQNKRSIKTNDQLDTEFAIASALKELMNFKEGADSMAQSVAVRHCTISLVSARLSTRKVISEFLMLLTYWSPGRSHVLKGLQLLAERDNTQLFESWFNIVDESLDYVDHKDMETVKEYCLATLFLINALLETAEINERFRLRSLFEDCDVERIFDKMKKLDYAVILEQIQKYEEYKFDDMDEWDASPVIDHLLKDLAKILSSKSDDDPIIEVFNSILESYLHILTQKDTEECTIILHKLSEITSRFISDSNLRLGPSVTSDTRKQLQLLIIENDELRFSIEQAHSVKNVNSDRQKKEMKLFSERLSKAENLNHLLELHNENLQRELQILKTKADLTTRAKLVAPQLTSTDPQSLIIEHGIKNMQSKSSDMKKIQSPLFKISSDDYFEDMPTPYSQVSQHAIEVDFKQSDTKLSLTTYSEKLEYETFNNSSAIEGVIKNGSPSALASIPASKDEQLNATSPMNGTNEQSSNIQTVADPALSVPPPPPPLPAMLLEMVPAIEKQIDCSIPAPPPPPFFLVQPASRLATNMPSSLPLPPPPPPPLPSLLLKTGLPQASPSLPPPPPPLPSLLIKTSAQQVPPPPPPPLPSHLTKNSPTSQQTQKEAPKKASSVSSAGVEHQSVDLISDNEKKELIIKNIPKPKKKLKQIHWDKIDTNKIDNTFWNELDAENNIGDDIMRLGILEEVETFFAVKDRNIKIKSKTQANEANDKKSFLPRDLAQHFGINLHPLNNLAVPDLVTKVLHCDPIVIDNIQVLEFFNKDDVNEFTNSIVKNFTPYSTSYMQMPPLLPQLDPANLKRDDRIFLELCFNLRHYWQSRSRSLLLIKTYLANFHDLCQKIDLIDGAISALKESQSFKKVMDMIRIMGNFMNDDSKRAVGFRLSILQRLKFMKDESNTISFLQYIEKTIRNSFPDLGEFVDELGDVLPASKISIDNLVSDCEEYQKHIKNCIMSTQKGVLSDPSKFHPEDRILSVLERPLKNANYKSELLEKKIRKTLSDLEQLMEYLGETNVADRNGMFTIIAHFIEEFKRSYLDNIQREEEERAKETRVRMLKEQQEKRKVIEADKENLDSPVSSASSTSKTPTASIDVEQRNSVMESLLEKLKNSEMSSEQRRPKRASTLSAYYQIQKFRSPEANDDLDDDDVEARAQRMLRELKNLA